MFLKQLDLVSSASCHSLPSVSPPDEDPYQYQGGFGNHHVSEAVPGALPKGGTNMPQKCAYGLYPEHLNGTSFISSRDTVSNVWMYRVKPGVVHRPLVPSKARGQIESCFLPTNPNVTFTPLSHCWGEETGLPADSDVNFIQGLKTIGGHGDPTLKEGLAVHMYSFNADMRHEALVNNDGALLIVPQRGTLDIQTELGYLRVPPGDIAVVPAGFRFAVRIVIPTTGSGVNEARPSSAVGYALEVFGSHFSLPELGPLGGNGLAHVRDFDHPVAAFDADGHTASAWRITVKLAGKLYNYAQPHTPFDVVAWHGRYAPYKYQLSRFAHLTANTDQLDPTAYCVLTAPSKWPGVSLVDFCIFGEKWAVAMDTVRLPYYHRTVATEVCGIIKGQYKGSVRRLQEGGLSFESAYMPHGESYDAWKRDENKEQRAEIVGRDYLGFMFHISAHMGLTKWATEEHPDIRYENPAVWDNFRGDFWDNIEEVNCNLSKAGFPPFRHEQDRHGVVDDAIKHRDAPGIGVPVGPVLNGAQG